MFRNLWCLLPLVLFQTVHAADVLGLQPGTDRSEAARVLAPLFPTEQALKPSATNTRFFNVTAYDAACKSNQCLAQYSEQRVDNRNTVRSESVGASFTRKDRLESLRHESMTLVADGKCQAELDAKIAAILTRAGKPAHESVLRRGGVEIRMRQWAGCASGGECLIVESSCGLRGEATLVQSVSNFAFGKQDR